MNPLSHGVFWYIIFTIIKCNIYEKLNLSVNIRNLDINIEDKEKHSREGDRMEGTTLFLTLPPSMCCK